MLFRQLRIIFLLCCKLRFHLIAFVIGLFGVFAGAFIVGRTVSLRDRRRGIVLVLRYHLLEEFDVVELQQYHVLSRLVGHGQRLRLLLFGENRD